MSMVVFIGIKESSPEGPLLPAMVSHFEIASDNAGGLKGSMQHWLAVYPPEFQIPMFFVAVD